MSGQGSGNNTDETLRPDASGPIRAALLQRHKSLLNQLTLMQSGCRVVCLLIAAYLAIKAPDRPLSDLPLWGVYVILLIIWTVVQAELEARIGILEHALARSAQGLWEDSYIQSNDRYTSRFYIRNDFLEFLVNAIWAILRREKMWWLLILIVEIIIHFNY
jgi:hypothetical protein